MKTPRTKTKLSITLDSDILRFLENFENKSKYVENLIYKDIREKGMLRKEIIL